MSRVVAIIRTGWLLGFGATTIYFSILWFKKGGGIEAYIVSFSSIATLGEFFFHFIEKVADRKHKPMIEMEIRWANGLSESPMLTQRSPQDDEGNFLIERGGLYWFVIHHDFDLIIRNNSVINAYNLKVFVDSHNLELSFKSSHNPLDPLPSHGKIVLNFKYTIRKEMKHDEADKMMNEKYPEEIKNMVFLVSYQNEERSEFHYTKFSHLNNQAMREKPDMNGFNEI